MSGKSDTPLHSAFRRHERRWRENAFCYPVVSRRSGGLSIGINLNPDKACNFDCIYCQVDRRRPPTVRKVDLDRLRVELHALLEAALDESLFAEPPFDCLGPAERHIRDLAFSGDGEPTTCPRFDEAVRIAVEAKRVRGLADTKLVLLTDACYLTQPKVRTALELLDENNGEVWAKLDAGTEDYYQAVCRPNFPLSHVLDNILDAARRRPIVIQSMWMNVHGEPPPEEEVRAFAERLNAILSAGGQIKLVQIYTIARQTAETYATALSRAALDRVASIVRRSVSAPVEVYHGLSG